MAKHVDANKSLQDLEHISGKASTSPHSPGFVQDFATD